MKILIGVLLIAAIFAAVKCSNKNSSERVKNTVVKIAGIPPDAEVTACRQTQGGMEPVYQCFISWNACELVAWAEQNGLSAVSDSTEKTSMLNSFKIGFNVKGSESSFICYNGIMKGSSFWASILIDGENAYVVLAKF